MQQQSACQRLIIFLDHLKNEDDLKNGDDLKKEDDLKTEDDSNVIRPKDGRCSEGVYNLYGRYLKYEKTKK